MCGILGVIETKNTIDHHQLIRSTTTLRHRGPNDEGYLLMNRKTGFTKSYSGSDTDKRLQLPNLLNSQREDYNLAFGFRRLSIIDLSEAGHQPMSSPDGRFWIMLNGEIYNYIELRREYQKTGYEFRSQTDTEVLLAGFTIEGKDVLQSLVGMFAFAVLDTQKMVIFLARDFFGIKPLYYSQQGHRFAFASEIKALLEFPWVHRNINSTNLYDYLRYGRTDHNNGTLYQNVQQISPAHYMEVPLDEPHLHRVTKYWHIDGQNKSKDNFKEASETIRELFLKNISLHLRSDVPVGAALSGGLDSASIVMAMRKIQPSDLDLHTITYVAADDRINEEAWAERVGRETTAMIHKVKPNEEEFASEILNLIALQDEPFVSTSIYAQFKVFQLAKQAGITVMLDGQGADELLGGYSSYLSVKFASILFKRNFRKASHYCRAIGRRDDVNLARFLFYAGGLLLPSGLQDLSRHLVGEEVMPNWLNKAWFTSRGIQPKSQLIQPGHDMLMDHLREEFEVARLPMLLRYEDRNSMVHSIESRVPFLTPDLVRYIFSLPDNFLIDDNGQSKAVFRRSMHGIVPKKIIQRKDKIGFETPELDWLTNRSDWVTSVLTGETAFSIPALAPNVMTREWELIQSNRKRFDFRVWRWLNIILWAEINQVIFES